ncbi:nitroreductase family protein [Lichenifustis flavocetrariae]|uniref:Putative NAD(P)H nitroreductase n=1 Tax=Lichenifustis flavocetrariae TaxID=2949735 RepID=A0AA42CMA2_9HYPH|nr:nitroreductase [Lichenifustis flavocetrariae]MCW6512469.1 nitroreductase [Lichenifustis flavocetrariae]
MTDIAHPDTLDLQTRRRSVPPPALTGPGPDPVQLQTLLTIAARVPDHGKLAPWRFIVFEGEGRLRAGEALAALYAADHPEADAKRLDLERRRLAQAPLVIGVVSRAAPHVKIPEWEQLLSAGAVAMNLILAANAMGFATSWLTEWYAYDRRALTALGLDETEKMAGFIHIGRPTAVIEDRVRPNLADLITRF